MNNQATLIILAGGKSERMGTPKGLLHYKNSYWILEQIKRFSVYEKSKEKIVFIGLGYDYKKYFKKISWLQEAIKKPVNFIGCKVQVVINKQPQFGYFFTLQTVLKEVVLQNKKNDVLILPIDVPLLKLSDLQNLLKEESSVVIPVFRQKKGHPVVLSSKIWNSFLSLPVDDVTARLDKQIQQLSSNKIMCVEVEDSDVILNLNTPNLWKRYLKNIR